MIHSIKKGIAITGITVAMLFGSYSNVWLLDQQLAVVNAGTVPDSIKGINSYPAVGSIDVAFSPEGGITNMIVGEIGKATKSVQVQAYSFTSEEIIEALIDAKKRGADVRIILDKSNVSEDSRNIREKQLLNSLLKSGIPIHIDEEFRIAHNKIIIVDGQDIITGSFNFTYSAEHFNAENCLILHGNKPLAEEYMKNWQWRWDETRNFKN